MPFPVWSPSTSLLLPTTDNSAYATPIVGNYSNGYPIRITTADADPLTYRWPLDDAVTSVRLSALESWERHGTAAALVAGARPR